MSALADELTAACASALARHRDERLDEVLARLAAIEARLPPLLARPAKAAKVLDVSLATVKRRIRDGTLPTTKVGDLVLVDLGRLRGVDRDEIARLAAQAG